MSKAQETIKKYTDAATVDILGFLHVSEPHVFHFRRIEKIAKLMAALVGSVGTPRELMDTASAMREMEGVSETLHTALEGHAFDGEELLRKKYQELHEFHRSLSQRKLDMEEAHATLSLAHSKLSLRRKLLDEQTTHIERERERLQLQADAVGKTVDLPPMPALGMGDEDDVAEGLEHIDEEDPRDNEDMLDDTGTVQQPAVHGRVVRENY